jgi:hypothetical protein
MHRVVNVRLILCTVLYTKGARNSHAPYCHLWPLRLYYKFPHNLISGTIFRKKATENTMCVLIFCTTFVRKISHSKKNWARYDQKCVLGFV